MIHLIVAATAAWYLLPPSRVEREIVESLSAPRTPRTKEQRSEDRRAFAVVGIYFSVAAICLITAQHIFGA